jgi:hypothetical protein
VVVVPERRIIVFDDLNVAHTGLTPVDYLNFDGLDFATRRSHINYIKREEKRRETFHQDDASEPSGLSGRN